MRDSVFSLYCLDNDDDYLGCCEAQQVGSSWMGFETVTAGTFFLSSKRLFFEPFRTTRNPSPSILTIQRSDARDIVVDVHSTPWQLSLQSTCHTEAFTRCEESLVGPWRPVQQRMKWRFRFTSAAPEWQASLNTLLSGSVERRLQQRERAVQSAHLGCASFPVKRVLPLREQRGVLRVSADRITFEPLFECGCHRSCSLPCDVAVFMFPRWILFRELGLDFRRLPAKPRGPTQTLVLGASLPPDLSFSFFSVAEKREAVRVVVRLTPVRLLEASLTALTRAWQTREISNYDYLLSLNFLSSRSYLDLHQYPVFPWVLKDYSAHVDTQHPSAYRDLSKPIGALEPARLEQLRVRAEVLVEMGQPFHLYASHYSSAWAVSYYHVRLHPEYQFCLQSGHLDNADRLFESLSATWCNVNRGTSDFKELIPEFFDSRFESLAASPPASWQLELGVKQDGASVARTLELPPTTSSTAAFARFHREALESEYVSSTLHLWIDLIFGVKQDGDDAQLAANVFHPYCYPQPSHGARASDGKSVDASAYAREFGNVPMKLFMSLHPGRNSYRSETRQTAYAHHVTHSDTPATPTLPHTPPHREFAAQAPLPAHLGELSLSDSSTPDRTTPAQAVIASEPFQGTTTVCVLTEAARFATAVPHARLVHLSVFTAVGSAEESEQLVRATVVDTECQSVFLYDCLSGERLRFFSDFESSVVHVGGYHEAVFLFTTDNALYMLDANTCTIVGHVRSVCGDAPVRLCSFAHALLALVNTQSVVGVWQVQDSTSAEVALNASPVLLFEAPGAVTCACVQSGNNTETCENEVLHLVLCTSSGDLIQHRGFRGERHSSHRIPLTERATAVTFSSSGEVIVFAPDVVLTLRADDGVVLRLVDLPRASLPTPLPLLYDGADYLVLTPNDEGTHAAVLVRDGCIAGGVAPCAQTVCSAICVVASAEYFVLGSNPHDAVLVVHSVDAT